MHQAKSSLAWLSVALLVVLVGGGCTPSPYGDLGLVTGTVTYEGQPYPNAMVLFTPTAGGRPSRGITDESGKYELIYIRTTRGALPGDHTVMITTVPPPSEERKIFKETLPPRYNTRTELQHTVELGENVIDFDLEKK
ncbi:carboxypeptidase-like regulatory domain-containing protein [Bremerella cremea]|uniref:carboxypeptidase-like regulatory domain-containing protein n=1 Tax=Bremerella cremea TaxID=1031537 RepID=UPI0031F1984D